MDMMTITQLAQQTDLAPPTVRRYLDDFILYVPSVRVDNTIGFPPEAVTVIRTIHGLTEQGHSHTEIISRLEATYPITVISAQPLDEGQSLPSAIPAIKSLLQTVDHRYGALVHELARLRSEMDAYAETNQLVHVPAELGQIRQVINMLARRVAETTAATAANPEIAEHRQDVAELRALVEDRWVSDPSPEVLGSLKSEIALLKRQIAEMQSERGQLVTLITALQETLGDLRQDRHLPTGTLPTPLFSLGGQPIPASAVQRSAKEPPAPAQSRRRLGHTTAREPSTATR
jgi:DNA-binding transcriptional MerR regulator